MNAKGIYWYHHSALMLEPRSSCSLRANSSHFFPGTPFIREVWSSPLGITQFPNRALQIAFTDLKTSLNLL